MNVEESWLTHIRVEKIDKTAPVSRGVREIALINLHIYITVPVTYCRYPVAGIPTPTAVRQDSRSHP